MKEMLKKVWPVLKAILTHKVTYRFLIVLLGALGIHQLDNLQDTIEAIAAAIFGPLQ